MRWAVIRGKKPIQSLGGDLDAAREKINDLTQKTGIQHYLELFSRRFEKIGIEECFRPVIRRGFGDWSLGPVCRKMNSLGQYRVVGVDLDRFPATFDAYSMPSEAEVLPWRDGESA